MFVLHSGLVVVAGSATGKIEGAEDGQYTLTEGAGRRLSGLAGPAHRSAACSVPGSGWDYNLKERPRCRPAAGAAASESLTQFDVVDNRLRPVPCQTSELLFTRSLGEEAISFRRAVTPALTEHASLRRQAQEDLADGLEMDRAALALLGARVDVTQAALERVFVEDRGRAGGSIDRRDDFAGLVDRPGRGEAQPGVLLGPELPSALGLRPHLGQGLVDQGAGGAQARLALRDLRLDYVVLAQGTAGAAGDLVAGQHDKRVERTAGDAERDIGEARGVDHAAGKAVEQARLAALGLVVARGGIFLRDEEIVEAIAVAAGAAQPDDLPVVDDLGAGLRKQYRTHERAAVRVESRRAVWLEDRDMRAEPGGVPAAGGKGPAPGDPDAALNRDAAAGTR